MSSASTGRSRNILHIDETFVRQWHPRYDDTECDEREYRKLLEVTRGDTAAFATLSIQTFTAILDWKSARVKGHIDWTAFPNYANAIRAACCAPDDATMRQLVALPGIGAPVASTFLHFLHPSEFPIIDRRTVDVLHLAGCLQQRGQMSTTTLDSDKRYGSYGMSLHHWGCGKSIERCSRITNNIPICSNRSLLDGRAKGRSGM
jgi:hypothetical protein